MLRLITNNRLLVGIHSRIGSKSHQTIKSTTNDSHSTNLNNNDNNNNHELLTTNLRHFSVFQKEAFKNWVNSSTNSTTPLDDIKESPSTTSTETTSQNTTTKSNKFQIPKIHQYVLPLLEEVMERTNNTKSLETLYSVWKYSAIDGRQAAKPRQLLMTTADIDQQTYDRINEVAKDRQNGPSEHDLNAITLWKEIIRLPAYSRKGVAHVGKHFTSASDPPLLKSELRDVINQKGPKFIYDHLQKENNDPKLRQIFQPEDIAWDNIPPFVVSSRDPTMRSLAKLLDPKITSSTSSFTGLLGLCILSITGSARTHSNKMGDWTETVTSRLTKSALRPISVILRRRSNITWGCDTFPSGDPKPNDILIDLGKSLELQLTSSSDQFIHTYLSDEALEKLQVTRESKHHQSVDFDSYQYMTYGDILLRSQLDCVDTTKDGKRVVFDLKTRAVVPIRYDVANFKKYLSYNIISQKGMILSTEREKYDMIRSAYMKYNLQCKIGDMGGILVAYHNTKDMFAVEYISTEEMSESLFGNEQAGDYLFHQSLGMANELLSKIVSMHGNDPNVNSIRVTVSPKIKNANNITGLYVVVETPNFSDPTISDEEYLADRHNGPMYIDSMSQEQVEAALTRRGIPIQKTEAMNKAQLEAYVCPPSGTLDMSYQYAASQIKKGNVHIYNILSSISTPDLSANIAFSEVEPHQYKKVSVRTTIKKHQVGEWLAPLYCNIYNAYHGADSSTPRLGVYADIMSDDVKVNIQRIYQTYYNAALELTKPIINAADNTIETLPESIRQPEIANDFPLRVKEMVSTALDFDPLERFTNVKEATDYLFVHTSTLANDIKRVYETDIGLLPQGLRTSDQFSRAILNAAEVAEKLIDDMVMENKIKISHKVRKSVDDIVLKPAPRDALFNVLSSGTLAEVTDHISKNITSESNVNTQELDNLVKQLQSTFGSIPRTKRNPNDETPRKKVRNRSRHVKKFEAQFKKTEEANATSAPEKSAEGTTTV